MDQTNGTWVTSSDHETPAMSHDDHMASHETPVMSHDDHMASHETAAMSDDTWKHVLTANPSHKLIHDVIFYHLDVASSLSAHCLCAISAKTWRYSCARLLNSDPAALSYIASICDAVLSSFCSWFLAEVKLVCISFSASTCKRW